MGSPSPEAYPFLLRPSLTLGKGRQEPDTDCALKAPWQPGEAGLNGNPILSLGRSSSSTEHAVSGGTHLEWGGTPVPWGLVFGTEDWGRTAPRRAAGRGEQERGLGRCSRVAPPRRPLPSVPSPSPPPGPRRRRPEEQPAAQRPRSLCLGRAQRWQATRGRRRQRGQAVMEKLERSRRASPSLPSSSPPPSPPPSPSPSSPSPSLPVAHPSGPRPPLPSHFPG
ncbi:basic proline-rich protein-like [Mustela lutreola]|uniref:basic proline-rich protein-like n=1 Tax=Mustela lutreola TaxID=9666 RepID=UPI002797A2E0|nr:basic proline-rich protein-like [Mustela lutreola]